jgi:GT2 family glycosyltransferase
VPEETGRPAVTISIPEALRQRRGPRKHPWLRRAFWLWRDKGIAYVLDRAWLKLRGPRQYDPDWIRAHDTLSGRDIKLIKERIARLARRPVFSAMLPVSSEPTPLVRTAIEALIGQIYQDWELHIVGDRTMRKESRELAERSAASDARIKFVPTGDIGAAASNRVLTRMTGEWIVRLPLGGQLARHALYLLAEEINRTPEASLIYADEDEVDAQGRRGNPHLKSDWNPDLFLSHNYIGDFVAYHTERVREAGGFRERFTGAEDYDLMLRLVERIAGAAIRHLPFILLHRPAQQVPDAIASEPDWQISHRHALADHLLRTRIDATVELGPGGRTFRVRRHVPGPLPTVSLIIPTRDGVELLKGAIGSILERTDYSNYEIVIVDNQSAEPEAVAYLAALAREPRVRVLRYDRPFNFSAINNFAARQCTSDILGLLNNDVVVINEDWLSELVSHAVRPEVGAVGGMLYYPDDTIQHAGIVVGYGGVAINEGGLPRSSPGYLWRLEAIRNCSAVTGACLFTRAAVFAEAGGLNEEHLAIAFNDVDYCLRLRARGYLVTWTPYAKLYHLESVSRGDDMARDKILRFRREEAFFMRRWAEVLPHDPYYNQNLSNLEGLFLLGDDVRVARPWRGDG